MNSKNYLKTLRSFLTLALILIFPIVGEAKTLSTYRAGLEFAAGRFIALDQNYGALTLFAVPGTPIFKTVHFVFDAKALKLENNNWAASGGFGLRKWDKANQKVYGANLFYDYRCEKSDSFHQVGLGLELLSGSWEFHLNGYLPVGRTGYQFSKYTLDNFTDGFLATVRNKQYALRGVEGTVGGRFIINDELALYVAPGLYYYNNTNIGNVEGVQLNASLGWNDWVSFRLNASYDSKFKGRVQGIVNLSVPFDFSCSEICATCRSMLLGRPIQRNDTVFIKRCRSVDSNWDSCGRPVN